MIRTWIQTVRRGDGWYVVRANDMGEYTLAGPFKGDDLRLQQALEREEIKHFFRRLPLMRRCATD